MNIGIYECNFELSMRLQSEFDQLFKRNQCYSNIWKAFIDTGIFYQYQDLKIAYGYVQIYDNVYARHCFLIENDKAVELTIKECRYKQYFAIIQFDVIAYMGAINQAKSPDLTTYSPLQAKFEKFSQWAMNNHLLLID